MHEVMQMKIQDRLTMMQMEMHDEYWEELAETSDIWCVWCE